MDDEDDDTLRAVPAMLKRARRLTVTPADLVRFLQVKQLRGSLGAAIHRGALLGRYPLETTRFAATRPGQLPPEERSGGRAGRRRGRTGGASARSIGRSPRTRPRRAARVTRRPGCRPSPGSQRGG
ncbi:MAG: hypothetical protein AB1730_09205 [Myxococcota bacterium]|jgi:hypothetical protein